MTPPQGWSRVQRSPQQEKGSAINMQPGQEMPVLELSQPFPASLLRPFQRKGTSYKKPSWTTRSREAALPPSPSLSHSPASLSSQRGTV